MKVEAGNRRAQTVEARTLVVSLHDVSPRTRPVFEAMLAELGTLGVARCSLLVIHDHHRRFRRAHAG